MCTSHNVQRSWASAYQRRQEGWCQDCHVGHTLPHPSHYEGQAQGTNIPKAFAGQEWNQLRSGREGEGNRGRVVQHTHSG